VGIPLFAGNVPWHQIRNDQNLRCLGGDPVGIRIPKSTDVKGEQLGRAVCHGPVYRDDLNQAESRSIRVGGYLPPEHMLHPREKAMPRRTMLPSLMIASIFWLRPAKNR
jgi:hypothetical protein